MWVVQPRDSSTVIPRSLTLLELAIIWPLESLYEYPLGPFNSTILPCAGEAQTFPRAAPCRFHLPILLLRQGLLAVGVGL